MQDLCHLRARVLHFFGEQERRKIMKNKNTNPLKTSLTARQADMRGAPYDLNKIMICVIPKCFSGRADKMIGNLKPLIIEDAEVRVYQLPGRATPFDFGISAVANIVIDGEGHVVKSRWGKSK